MPGDVTTQKLVDLLGGSDAHALLDVREAAEYNAAHVRGALSLPRRLIELRVEAPVPFKGTQITVCDDDGRRAQFAAATLLSLGYTSVGVLSGGLNRWTADGRTTEWGCQRAKQEVWRARL